MSLRQTLIEVANSKQSKEGQQTKMELVYDYLTGPRFRHRVEAIVEKFSDMQADLDREKKSMARLWAKPLYKVQFWNMWIKARLSAQMSIPVMLG